MKNEIDKESIKETTPYVNFSLRSARNLTGYTLKELGKSTGITSASIVGYEHLYCMPSLINSEKIVYALNERVKNSPSNFDLKLGDLETRILKKFNENEKFSISDIFPKEYYQISSEMRKAEKLEKEYQKRLDEGTLLINTPEQLAKLENTSSNYEDELFSRLNDKLVKEGFLESLLEITDRQRIFIKSIYEDYIFGGGNLKTKTQKEVGKEFGLSGSMIGYELECGKQRLRRSITRILGEDFFDDSRQSNDKQKIKKFYHYPVNVLKNIIRQPNLDCIITYCM